LLLICIVDFDNIIPEFGLGDLALSQYPDLPDSLDQYATDMVDEPKPRYEFIPSSNNIATVMANAESQRDASPIHHTN